MKISDKPYEAPLCRVKDLLLEAAFLTGSTDPYPVDPVDPEFD